MPQFSGWRARRGEKSCREWQAEHEPSEPSRLIRPMPVFGQVDALRRLTGLIYFPITPTFPWLGPLGMLGYLPAKFRIRFLEPIDTVALGGAEAAEDKALVQTVAQEIRAQIQENLHEMLAKRRSVWLG